MTLPSSSIYHLLMVPNLLHLSLSSFSCLLVSARMSNTSAINTVSEAAAADKAGGGGAVVVVVVVVDDDVDPVVAVVVVLVVAPVGLALAPSAAVVLLTLALGSKVARDTLYNGWFFNPSAHASADSALVKIAMASP